MAAFLVSENTRLSVDQAWDRVTDWPRHGRFVPLTSITVDPPGPTRVGTIMTARTGGSTIGFDDPMEVVEWHPPAGGHGGRCRLEKRGTMIRGWAEIVVEPRGAGSSVSWREEALPRGVPAFAHRPAARVGKVLFGRVLRGLLRD